MPKRFVAAGCSTASGQGYYSLHEFPRNKALRAKWVQAVKRYWDGPTASSMLCSKHFEQDC